MNVAIIGAGFAGLAAAYELQKHDHVVTIFEAAPQAGGLAAGFKAPHWEWSLEKFYHHLFANDDAIIGLTHEIGFGDKLRFYSPSTVFVHEGRTYPFDSPLAAARYPGLSLLEKARLGPALLYLRYLVRDWRPLERVTAHDWMRRTMGSAYHTLWEPMLLGKFGEALYRQVPLSWFWARFVKRTPQLGYYDGGFQAFADALVQAVEERGGAVHLATPVERLQRSGMQWEVISAHGVERFDQVIATLPPSVMARAVPELPADYLDSLARLRSLGAVVLTVALDRQLTPNSYWINLDKRHYPMLALVEHTNMVDPRHYGGDHLIYLGDYLPTDHPYLHYSADQLFDVYEPALKAFNPAYERAWVRDRWLFSAAYAQPVPPLHYSRQIPPIKTPLPGLFFASMSQVYPWDRGTNYAVEIGQRAAREALQAQAHQFA